VNFRIFTGNFIFIMSRSCVFLLLLVLPCCYNSDGQVINTFAGTGTDGFSGDGGPATAAKMVSPSGVATDIYGNVYIADQNNSRIRMVNAAGIITTIAGNGTTGYSGDGGPATNAQIYWPSGVAIDRMGNIYIADQFNDAIRKIDTTGTISTIAGNGTPGYTGDGMAATSAELWHPVDVGVDYAGNVYALDQDNSAVREINAATGIITTLAGNGTAGYAGDGGPSTAAQLNFPQGICVDSAGNIWVADFYNSRVREINVATGIITTVAGGGTSTAEGVPATAATFAFTSALARDQAGNLYVNDYNGFRVRKIYTNGIIYTIAGNGSDGYIGDGGPATAAEVSGVEGLAVNDSGDVFIADFGSSVVRIITEVPRMPPALSTENATLLSGIEIFPNPSSGLFYIQTNDNQAQYLAQVYDVMGKKVYESAFNSSKTTVNLENLIPGIYLLQIKSSRYNGIGQFLIFKSY
jgi:sugar lactone lactonase YvrE